VLPTTESLLDCQERARPLWEYKISNDVAEGKTVVVVAHRDTVVRCLAQNSSIYHIFALLVKSPR